MLTVGSILHPSTLSFRSVFIWKDIIEVLVMMVDEAGALVSPIIMTFRKKVSVKLITHVLWYLFNIRKVVILKLEIVACYTGFRYLHTFEPLHDKINKMAWAPSEDSDQPGHPPSLIRVFAVRMKKPWVLSYPLSAERRLGSDWADAQADLSLRWAHMQLCWFCHEAAHLFCLFTALFYGFLEFNWNC